MRINTGMYIGMIIHCIIAMFLFFDPEIEELGYVGLGIVAFNVIGVILVLLGKKRIGYILFMISSIILIPIGLIGALSARQKLDELKEEKFNKKN